MNLLRDQTSSAGAPSATPLTACNAAHPLSGPHVAPRQARTIGRWWQGVKVLLIDDDELRAAALRDVLVRDPAIAVVRHRRGDSIADALTAHRPDLVLIDMARADRDTLDCVRQVSASDPRPIALFVDQDDPGFMAQAIGAGVSSYTAGTPPADLKPVLRAAVALFEQFRITQERARQAEAELRDRQTIDRAKHRLMRTRRLTEPDAHRYLQRQAMARGRRLADIASEILSGNAHE